MESLIIIFIFLFGLSAGSFLNVLIDRLSQEEKITGRSYCDHCGHQLAWQDLIPLISFLILKRRCRYCGKKISFQYPLVEFLTGVFFVLIALNLYPVSKPFFSLPYPHSFYLLIANFVIVACLIVIFFADLKYQIIPDQIEMVLFCASLIILPFYNQPIWLIFFHQILAALIIMAPIFFINFLTAGKAMGFGDVKLAFNIGFLLGLKAGFLALYFAFVLGGIVGLILILSRRKKLKSKIAFGPFLAIGVLIMLFWRAEILRVFLGFYGL